MTLSSSFVPFCGLQFYLECPVFYKVSNGLNVHCPQRVSVHCLTYNDDAASCSSSFQPLLTRSAVLRLWGGWVPVESPVSTSAAIRETRIWSCEISIFPRRELVLPWWFSSKESVCNAEDVSLILGSERAPGGGNGNPPQYSCLGIPWTEEPDGLQSRGL